MTREQQLERAIADAGDRVRRIDVQCERFSSPHEAFGVLAEEVAEFFDEVRKRDRMWSKLALRNEAIDIAVVALRIAATYSDAAKATCFHLLRAEHDGVTRCRLCGVEVEPE